MARWPAPDRGRVGVRGARTRFADLSVGRTFDPALANVVDSTGPTPVGTYPDGASWVGALDMAGNAMEWVADWLDAGYYADSPAVDPTGPDGGRNKVEKGGWWGSNPFVARAAYRHYEDPPNYADEHIGFRVLTPISARPVDHRRDGWRRVLHGAGRPALDDHVLALAREQRGRERPRVCSSGPPAETPTATSRASMRPSRAGPNHPPRAVPADGARPPLGPARQRRLYVGGGNTADMLAIWRVHGVDAALRDAWRPGS